MPQLGNGFLFRYASAAIAQLNGIYLWGLCLASSYLVAKVNKQ